MTSSLELDAALDAIELIGLALAVMPAPSDADRVEIRQEALQFAEQLLVRHCRRPAWRISSGLSQQELLHLCAFHSGRTRAGLLTNRPLSPAAIRRRDQGIVRCRLLRNVSVGRVLW
jgi:hypothetical protein